MPTMTPQIDIGDLLARVSLEDLVRGAFGPPRTSRKGGAVLVHHCGFHGDRGQGTPDLLVDRAEQRFTCWVCPDLGGRWHDAIDFVRHLHGVSFLAACERLAGGDLAAFGGLPPLHRPASSRSRERPGVVTPDHAAALDTALDWAEYQLQADGEAREYCRARGFPDDFVRAHRFGYIPGGDDLARYLEHHGHLERARELGLFGSAEEPDDRRCRFRHRIVIPHLVGVRPIWWTGRRIRFFGPFRYEGRDWVPPKYVHLPGPKPLPGWEDAALAPAVVFVEGIFDKLVLNLWGCPFAVATLGTAITPAVRALIGGVPLPIILADNDAAGVAAAERLDILAFGGRALHARLPGGHKDVADLHQALGAAQGFPLLSAALQEAMRRGPLSPPSAAVA
jgi:DNA primase